MPRLHAVSAAILLAGALAAPAFGQSAPTRTVKVVALLGVTGPIASIDVPSAEGIKLAANQINAAGGFTVAGVTYRLEADVEDVQGRPDQAVGLARKTLADKQAIAILGPVASFLAVPAVEVSQPKMLHLTPATIVQQQMGKPGRELLFDTLNPQYGEGGIAPGYLAWLRQNILEPKGIKRIAILLPNDSVGQLEADFFAAEMKKIGIEITGVEIFDPKTADFSARITKLKGGNPDALLWGYTDEVGKTIIRQSLELGLTREFIAAPGPSGAASADQADKIDFAVWPSSVVSVYNPNPRMQAFVAAYEKQVGRKINPGDQFSLYIHDATHMLVKAMVDAGTVTDSARIAAAFRDMKYSGVYDITVDQTGQFHTDWDVGRMDQGGKISWTTIKSKL